MVFVKYVKSPFNYVGGKYKLLDVLLPLFPSDINVFLDVFGGGGNVSVNVASESVVYNDHIRPLVSLLEYFSNHSTNRILDYIHHKIDTYGLSKYDKETFNQFRNYYNLRSNCILDLYILICYSFNYQLRFNNKFEYNSSHGTNRSSFTKTMENNLIDFLSRLHDINIQFTCKDYREINYNNLTSKDFVYFDPPYYISNASYNDGKRGYGNWTNTEETRLYQILDDLNKKNIRWGLSNIITNNNKTNNILQDWLSENNYNYTIINSNYNNSNYQKKNRNGNTELYIYNYPLKEVQTKLI